MTRGPGNGILLVDDSTEDVAVIHRVLQAAGCSCPFHHCWTGDEALDFLHRRGPYATSPTPFCPGLILLDLNLPGSDGRDILREIKTDQALKTIPVVVLTTSHDERDVSWCYQAGANSYVQKPVCLEDMYRALHAVVEYWCNTVLLPSSG
jgi:CheY-like chemotaxis protein